MVSELPTVFLVALLAHTSAGVDTVSPKTGPCAVVLSGDTARADSATAVGDAETEFTRRPVLAPGSGGAPTFPPAWRRPGYLGRALTSFVVDARGRVEAGTVSVVEATDPLVARWACVAAAALRFLPAERGGRKVRAFWGQPFEYRVPAAPARDTAGGLAPVSLVPNGSLQLTAGHRSDGIHASSPAVLQPNKR